MRESAKPAPIMFLMLDRPEDRALLSLDTDGRAEARQIEIWRSLSSVERGALIDGASRAARQLALAGLRTRYPEATEPELIKRLATITLGRELACRVYPELDTLAP